MGKGTGTRSTGHFRGRGRSQNPNHPYRRHHDLDNGGIFSENTEYPERYHANIRCDNVWTRKGRGEWFTRRSAPRARVGRSRLGTSDTTDAVLDDRYQNNGASDHGGWTFSPRERDPPSFDQGGGRIFKQKHSYENEEKEYYESNEDFNVDKGFPYYKNIRQAPYDGSLRKRPSKHSEEVLQMRKLIHVPKACHNNAGPEMKDIFGSTGPGTGGWCFYMLTKDEKMICRMQCKNPPIQLPSSLNVDIRKATSVKGLADLPRFSLFPACENRYQKDEWPKFMGFLYNNCKVAFVEFNKVKIYILPCGDTNSNKTEAAALNFKFAVVAYDVPGDANGSEIKASSLLPTESQACIKSPLAPDACMKDQKAMSNRGTASSTHVVYAPGMDPDANVKGSSSDEKGTCSSVSKYPEAASSHQHFSATEGNPTEMNFVRTDPSYLKTLGQAHSGWIFGAIAELVDNAMDANASRLDVSIETVYCRTAGCEIPMLSIIDDGDGMNHQEISRMISFGHKQPDEENKDLIGRFGVGFKTGTMRLGSDALVLTQTAKSRSIAFFSQTFNKEKDNVEIPIVSYRRQAQYMEFDTSVQSEALSKYNLKAIKNFSPFNEYLIGEKTALFRRDTGTQIYIWNLEKWGSDYTLEWQAGISGKSSFYHGDIFIRSRRVRSRPGQTSKKVYLDFSLRSYLEVIFLEPRMKIYIQGGLVKSRPLAKFLNNTAVVDGEIMGKRVQLTLGRCQEEWEYSNCGVFLYWHGRLIEAYKRVGGMVHSADMGRGVIGVIDVTELMDDGNGSAWVHSNKQGFQDCEAYALLEEWLGNKADEYWDTHFDAIELKKGRTTYNPDHEWVQCEKCRKWRMLKPEFDSAKLIGDWFCNMEPFFGHCEMPEQKPDPGVITIGTKRVGATTGSFDHKHKGVHVDSNNPEAKEANTMDNSPVQTRSKRLRKGLALVYAKK